MSHQTTIKFSTSFFFALAANCIIVFAAISKLSDLQSFRASLESWGFIPYLFRDGVAISVPAIEVTLASSWIINYHRRVVVTLSIAMLVLYSMFYITHVLFLEPPRCDCFGKWGWYNNEKYNTYIVISRNLILMLMLLLQFKKNSVSRFHVTTTPEGRSQSRKAFTLIELLVVIAVIAVVVGLSIGVLSKSRNHARTVRLANLCGQHARTINIYASGNRDAWPCLLPTDGSAVTKTIIGRRLSVTYEDQVWHWPDLAMEQTNPLTLPDAFLACQGIGPAENNFWYSPTFLTSPDYWREGRRTGKKQWRGTRVDEVVFPSSKVIICLLEGIVLEPCRGPDSSRLVSLGFVDGSTTRLDMFGGTNFMQYPGGFDPENGTILGVMFRGMATVDGVAGRDR